MAENWMLTQGAAHNINLFGDAVGRQADFNAAVVTKAVKNKIVDVIPIEAIPKLKHRNHGVDPCCGP